MLDVLPGNSQQTTTSLSACIGWTGEPTRRGGGISHDRGLLVAVDGVVLNAMELLNGERSMMNDSELVAMLYRRHGFVDAVRRLKGDYSLALFDEKSHTLWLARDRFGVKPLYYTVRKDSIAFSSVPRALLTLPDVSRDVNPGYVARFGGSHYRTFDNLPSESPFKSVHQLPASSVVSFVGLRQTAPKSYWSLEEKDDWTKDEETLADEYRALLMNAVSRRLDFSDRRIFTLSGGLDSSSVLSCAHALTGNRQFAVSSVYTDATYDERDEIADVVKEKVSEWRSVEIPNQVDLVGLVGELVRIHDEPVATATWLSHMLICKEVAAQGFNSIFGGLGGDELNAGEYEYFPYFFADLRAADLSDKLEIEIEAWKSNHDHPIYRKNAEAAASLMSTLVDRSVQGACRPDRNRMLRYTKAISPEYMELKDFEPNMDAPFSSYLKNRAYQDLFRETLPCCLRAEDRQCTEMGLAHFEPFLDDELVEFMFRVRGTSKIRNGITKNLLRMAMHGVLPEATRARVKKTGWNAPAHQWFSGTTLQQIRDIVSSRSFRERGIYNMKVVREIIDEHEEIVEKNEMRENHMMFLWQLLNLHLWLSGLEERPKTSW